MSESKSFLDTNILLPLLSADEAKAGQAEDTIAGGGVLKFKHLPNKFANVTTRKPKISTGISTWQCITDC
jgi:hypothetical protein